MAAPPCANVHLLQNKLDELQANINHLNEYRTASILALTVTCLNNSDSDNRLNIDGFSLQVRLDRDNKLTGKQHGGSICLFVSSHWCMTAVVREKLCTTDIELLAPFIYEGNFHNSFSFWCTSTPKQMLSLPLNTSWHH